MVEFRKVGLRIELQVHEEITQLWCRLPRNSTAGIDVPHRISGRFEFDWRLLQKPADGACRRRLAEAGGVVSLVGEFPREFCPSEFASWFFALAVVISDWS